MAAAVEIDHVSKSFRLYRERNQSLKQAILRRQRSSYQEFQALDDISLEVPTGTTSFFIGENGSGKSTLLKCIARILEPDVGSIRSHGKISALLELGAGFHPELSGRDNIFLNGAILGLSQRELRRRFDDIVAFAGLEDFIDSPVKVYSSGMYVRLGFAVAINVEPDILLVDEVLAVGDEDFQRRCADKFRQLRSEGRTIIVVSHALGSVRDMADRVAWMEHGRIRAEGETDEVIVAYLQHVSGRTRQAEVEEAQDQDDATTNPVGTWRPGWRDGTGEAVVTGVELLAPDDHSPRAVLRTGQDLLLRLHYDAKVRVESPVYGFAISTVDGRDVTAMNTLGIETDAIEGVGSVDLLLPKVLLAGGRFEITAAITAPDHHPYDVRHRLLGFEVLPGRPRDSGGVVCTEGVWHLGAGRPEEWVR